MNEWNERTNEQMNERTNERTNELPFLMPLMTHLGDRRTQTTTQVCYVKVLHVILTSEQLLLLN